MELTLEDAINSKIYIKGDSGFNYRSPKEYIQPFIDSLEGITENFSVRAVEGASNMNEEDASINNSYSRILVEAILPENYKIKGSNDWNSFNSTIGIVYALDLMKPVMKVYSGKNVTACTNLTIFNADNLYSQELTGDIKSIYRKTRDFKNSIDKELDDFLKSLNILTSTNYRGREIDEVIGKLVKQGIKNPKLGHSVIVMAAKELYNSKSIYAIKKEDKEDVTTAWNIFNAVTSELKKSDIIDTASKTLLLSNLFLN